MLKNINLLRTFECAARHQSYSQAASELCISQAAVSQQMRQLEEVLGVKLFVRKARQMHLTQQGQQLFVSCSRAFSLLQQGVAEVQQMEIAGDLTITSTQAFNALWLMPRLSQFSALHPQVNVRVVSGAEFDDLSAGHIDLAIRFGTRVEESVNSGFECEYLDAASVIPVCAPQLVQAQPMLEVQDLLQTWLVRVDKADVFDWPLWFETQGIEDYRTHKKWTQVSSTDMALNAVLSGHGVALVGRHLCQSYIDSGQLVVPVNIAHPNRVKRYLVYPSHSPKRARLGVFMDWLKQELACT